MCITIAILDMEMDIMYFEVYRAVDKVLATSLSPNCYFSNY